MVIEPQAPEFPFLERHILDGLTLRKIADETGMSYQQVNHKLIKEKGKFIRWAQETQKMDPADASFERAVAWKDQEQEIRVPDPIGVHTIWPAEPNGFYVYFLHSIDKILYVGKSSNIYARIFSHITDKNRGKQIQRISTIQYRTKEEMDLEEIRLIRELQPLWNITYTEKHQYSNSQVNALKKQIRIVPSTYRRKKKLT